MESVGIYVDEKYPVYYIGETQESADVVVEVPEDVLKKWKEVIDSYNEVQAEISKVVERASQ